MLFKVSFHFINPFYVQVLNKSDLKAGCRRAKLITLYYSLFYLHIQGKIKNTAHILNIFRIVNVNYPPLVNILHLSIEGFH